ncbi:tRNA (adenosine(37)-N6)-threonylcarbamoyltransferase complex ATPase subunit type 1 TsaE [Roseobacter sp. YSTF-M11]|uniref:tRNA (Adenosine(37)-N6)-threonylcarbamoyltransferase complex ATPase subunit type 1 TsaE n=1 Tax=Roseobacter insulae TaxID=2859783 RepID=A0A9X1JX76_9RHOB|nr:tRNA (adenosine(37)-N6)-threonylcarbamoyltransferase complex ATPase subunit type 1 TsaE [Roseobacter insulae]MBW4706696.1 tRNA (adenosine(37)-N6)-threonylcarbamoyltransferase complex ATPase subunit type 1 TsaE [Roseobacter insulae]
MVENPHVLVLKSSDETASAATRLAALLEVGDIVLLSGPVGAGKTHFARHLIQSALAEPEDIPSPTFTLVQTYETTIGPIWHADLYRLGTLGEIEELGLTDAFEEAICLVEWPDRLGPLRPPSALELWLSHGNAENERILKATWQDSRWEEKVRRWMS